MPSVMRPWTVRILVLVDEGVTDRDELIRLVTPIVPQGHAFRVRERHNAYMAERREARGLPTGLYTRFRTPAEIHRIGAREVLQHTLRKLVRQGHLVKDGTQYRRPTQGREARLLSGNGKGPITKDGNDDG